MTLDKPDLGDARPTFTSTDKMVARLLEFFHRRKPWHRRLWSIGTVLALNEVAEYGHQCLSGAHPSTEGLRFVVESSLREVQRDPGVLGLATELKAVLSRLDVDAPNKVKPSVVSELEHLSRRAADGYLASWMSVTSPTPVEFTSRALASHLLDLGFSGDHLHRWLTAKASSVSALGDLVGLADEMVREMQPRRYDVFVPCARPRLGNPAGDGHEHWLDGPRAAAWLESNAPGGETRRHNGGFVYSATERDPWAAVDSALELLHRTVSRIRVARASSDELKPDGWIRVGGVERQDFEARTPRRQVEIGSLERQGVVFDIDSASRSPIDDALELASYLEGTGTGAAVTGGWAAIEGLLIRPGERPHHLAADRLAALVACSLPRAELTPLSFAHEASVEDELTTSLRATESNRARVELVEGHLAAGGTLTLEDASDAAALDRILALQSQPADELGRVRNYVTESLRRLYSQRNLVMHAGTTESVVLGAALRTAPALVGAGLDRIAHAHFSAGQSTSPLDLVARAEVELKLVGTAGGRALATLLE